MKTTASSSPKHLYHQEIELREAHVKSWIEQQHAAGFGVDLHMANALNAYLEGQTDLAGLLAELRRPYLH
ncbi:MAG: hypothetical protein DI597_03665 [Pseudoxanthomonas spadix]|nr:MAG: hypothetical protein DI597_03665 [Pseudoxanthomonas spadix]